VEQLVQLERQEQLDHQEVREYLELQDRAEILVPLGHLVLLDLLD